MPRFIHEVGDPIDHAWTGAALSRRKVLVQFRSGLVGAMNESAPLQADLFIGFLQVRRAHGTTPVSNCACQQPSAPPSTFQLLNHGLTATLQRTTPSRCGNVWSVVRQNGASSRPQTGGSGD